MKVLNSQCEGENSYVNNIIYIKDIIFINIIFCLC
jgi:hypothetical protein